MRNTGGGGKLPLNRCHHRVVRNSVALVTALSAMAVTGGLAIGLVGTRPDRDAIASQLMRYRDGRGDDWADIIDFLTMYPDTRRQVVRLPGELCAQG
jgi:hypothetical protein